MQDSLVTAWRAFFRCLRCKYLVFRFLKRFLTAKPSAWRRVSSTLGSFGVEHLEQRLVLTSPGIDYFSQSDVVQNPAESGTADGFAEPRSPALNVILISSAVTEAEQISSAAINSTVRIYDHSTTTTESLVDLLSSISASHGHTPIGHLAIVTHGGAAYVQIGADDVWSLESLPRLQFTLSHLDRLLVDGAELDLYACSVAGSDTGKLLLDNLALMTNSVVFASSTPTGSGIVGDYELEYRAGLQSGNASELLSADRLEAIDGLLLAGALQVPLLSKPTDGVVVSSTTPTFQWSAVSGATSYRILVATSASALPSGSNDPGAGLLINEVVTNGTSYTPGAGKLSNGTTYYWEVRAGNSSTGAGSPWSSVRSFDTPIPSLVAPVLSGPANGASAQSTTPTFYWSAVSGATSYRILVATSASALPTGSNDPGTGLLINEVVTNGTSYTPIAGKLGNGTTYYWEVRAGNSSTGAGSPWSAVRSFDTIPAGLATTVLLGPADGASGLTTTPTFQWSAVSGATSYRILVATSPSALPTGSNDPGNGLVVNAEVTNGTSYTPTAGLLSNGATYYWEVRAGNSSTGAGSLWSSVRSFDTIPAGLATTVLLGPADGASGQTTTPTFQWSAISGATSYRILVATSPSALPTGSNDPGAGLLLNEVVDNVTSYTPAAGLLSNGTTYYWEVRAGNSSTGAGSAWSDIRRFTTAYLDSEVADGFDYPIAPPNSAGWHDAQDFGVNNHLGEDWNFGSGSDDLGMPVFAVANGVVTYSQDTAIDSWKGVIMIRHAGTFQLPGGGVVSEVESMYAHLDVSKINLWVQVGDRVTRGQQIGVIGPTPSGSSAPHLHFELRTIVGLGLGPGYSSNTSGRTNPSDFIDANRAAYVPGASLAAPTQLSATSISPSSIFVDWAGVSGASDYRLYRSTSPDGPWDHQIYFGSASQYYDSNDSVVHLAPGTKYYYRAASVQGGINSELSAVIAGATLMSAPPIVTNFDATVLAPGTIELTWDRVIATGDYFIERSNYSDHGFQQIAVRSANESHLVDSGSHILPNISYYYRIHAVSANVPSPYSTSAPVIVTTGYQQTPAQAAAIPNLTGDSLESVAKVYQWNWESARYELVSDADLGLVDWQKQTIILTHGWNDRLDLGDSNDFMVMFAQDFERGRTPFQKQQFNILAVDWWDGGSRLGSDPNNLRDSVGDALALQFLQDARLSAENGIKAAKVLAGKLVSAQIQPEKVMLIGHSNGAGFMGSLAKAINAALPGEKIDELVALDAPLETQSYWETASAAPAVNRISNYYQPLFAIANTIDVLSFNYSMKELNVSASFGGPMFASQGNITNFALNAGISDQSWFANELGHSQVPLRYSQTADLWSHSVSWGFQTSAFINGNDFWNAGFIWSETSLFANDSGSAPFVVSMSRFDASILSQMANFAKAIGDAVITGAQSVWNAGVQVHDYLQLSGVNSTLQFQDTGAGSTLPLIRGTAHSPVYATTDVRIPADAVALRFSLSVLNPGNQGDVLQVAIGNQVLGTINLAEHLRSGSPFVEYWVADRAGQTTQLQFLMPSDTPSSAEFLLSDITFGTRDSVDDRGPIASVTQAPAITQSGDAYYEFQVTYTDDVAVNVGTFSSGDIAVVEPSGYEQPAVYLRSDSSENGARRTATYRILAPGGSWNATDNGTYLIRSQIFGVADTSNNWAAAGVIGSIAVAIPVVDSAPPTAMLTSAPNVYDASSLTYEFQVTYTDDTAIDVDSLRGNNIFIDAPGTPGSGWVVYYLGVNDSRNGSPRVANYRMHVPGGSWDPSDNGVYTIRMQPYEVRDLNGNYVAATTLGTFTVAVAADVVAPTFATSITDGGRVTSGPSEIWFHFSEPMDQLGYISGLTTLSAEHLGLGGAGAGSAHATSASWVGTNSVKFTIDGEWGTGQVLYWFAGYPRDLAGNLAQLTMRSFSIDNLSPTMNTSIVEGSAWTSGPSEIWFFFSEAMDQNAYLSGLSMLSPQNLGLGGQGAGSAFATSATWVGDNAVRFTIGGTWGSGQVQYWFAGYPRDLAGNYANLAMRSFAIDDRPPQAWLNATPSITEPTIFYDFKVSYWDNVGLNLSTQDRFDVAVTGPNGFFQNPQLISKEDSPGGEYSIATYRVVNPNGNWNGTHNGTYFVTINPYEVFDKAGNAAPSATIGAFQMQIPINNAPVVAPQSFVLYNKAPVGTVVGTVQATDLDANQSRIFQLISGNGALTINASTGALTVANSQLLTGAFLQYMVRVTDNGDPSLWTDAQVTVLLRSSNSPADFLLTDADRPTVVTLVKNRATLLADESTDSTGVINGQLLATLAAADIDETGVFLPLTMTDKSGVFAFDAATGRLTMANAAKLNYEQTKSFDLIFKAIDHGLVGLAKPLTSMLTLTIKLVDQNDAPITAPTATFKLKENNGARATVGTVVARDEDQAVAFKTLRYSIVFQRDAAGSDVALFAIDGRGQISVPTAAALNYEGSSRYNLVVRVTDGGGLFREQNVTVQVIDVNEPVVLTLLDAARNPTAGISVAENTPVGTLVGFVRVDNPDTTRAETYNLTLSDTLGKAFTVGAVDPVTKLAPIAVLNSSKLNFEALRDGRFSLNVTIADSGFLSDDGSRQGSVTVKRSFVNLLLDVNEAPTILNWKSVSLPGGALPIPAGTIFGTASTVDLDRSPQTYAYSLVPGVGNNDLFVVDATTGQLRSAAALARKRVFTLLLRTTDQGGLVLDRLLTIKT